MKKRVLVLILVVLILLPLLPKPADAKALVKGIDVLMNDFKLQVEGKKLSHKEAFFYEGDLWVPIEDLGNALGVKLFYDSSKRVLHINSKGRLSFDDKSLEPIAFQRGYEILTKERLTKDINDRVRNFLNSTNSSANSQSSDLRRINVGFSDIRVKLDNHDINLYQEPLLYNDDVYLALTSLSPYLYITPKLTNNLVDIDLNGILKDKPFYTMETLVAFREALNDRYSRELAELNKKKAIIMDVKIPYEEVKSLSDMEHYLNKHLGKIKDLNVDVSLRTGTDHWYYLDIDFPSRDNYKWRNLTRRDVEAYVWDVYVAISSLYDEGAKLQGNIKSFVSFDTKMKNIVFSFLDSGLDMKTKVDPIFIQELLAKKLGRYRGEYFTYEARISGYDLELIVTADRRDFLEKWSVWQQLDLIQAINYEIQEYYPGLKVNGKVVYEDLDPLLFLIEDNKVRSNTLMASSENHLEDRFGILHANGLRIPMKYSLNQTDLDNFKLIVDMDVLISDPKWNREAQDALGALMDDVLKFIIDMWDTNIFVQVYDRKQTLAYEYVISQDTVQMVIASPGGGEIIEGSSVSLRSSTEGANIYYTLDGSNPSSNSQRYTSPIVITSDTTIRAFAEKVGFKDSPTATFIYTVIDDSNMASGLDSLVVEGFEFNTSFDKKQSNYTVNLPFGTKTVSVRARASVGAITIDGDKLTSKEITIGSDSTVISIVHSEDGKSKDRPYTINVVVEDKLVSDVKLDPGYSFSTFAFASFTGKLTGNPAGYKIRVLSTLDNPLDSATVNSSGEFDLSFPTDPLSNSLGYKYEVLDLSGNTVDSGKLNVTGN